MAFRLQPPGWKGCSAGTSVITSKGLPVIRSEALGTQHEKARSRTTRKTTIEYVSRHMQHINNNRTTHISLRREGETQSNLPTVQL